MLDAIFSPLTMCLHAIFLLGVYLCNVDKRILIFLPVRSLKKLQVAR